MLKLKEYLLGILAVTLASVMIVGCVQMGETPEGYESNDDCMFCHSRANAKTARALEDMYINTADHHPVEIVYPPQLKSDTFNVFNAKRGNKHYFDSNGNGKLDDDEIRLFEDGEGKIEITCSTCHREHEKSPVRMEEPDEDFLRGDSREFCHVCHRNEVRPIVHH